MCAYVRFNQSRFYHEHGHEHGKIEVAALGT